MAMRLQGINSPLLTSLLQTVVSPKLMPLLDFHDFKEKSAFLNLH